MYERRCILRLSTYPLSSFLNTGARLIAEKPDFPPGLPLLTLLRAALWEVLDNAKEAASVVQGETRVRFR